MIFGHVIEFILVLVLVNNEKLILGRFLAQVYYSVTQIGSSYF